MTLFQLQSDEQFEPVSLLLPYGFKTPDQTAFCVLVVATSYPSISELEQSDTWESPVFMGPIPH